MGVAGSGKTTIGRRLALALAVPFVDGDDVHPPANVARMRQGLPLDDEHRWPWLDALRDRLADAVAAGHGIVVACSALRQTYRDRLARDLPPPCFVHLVVDRATLAARLARRRGHFFPAALLDSQLATLQAPTTGVIVDATRPVADVVARLRARFT
jgi:gluconokinase